MPCIVYSLHWDVDTLGSYSENDDITYYVLHKIFLMPFLNKYCVRQINVVF